MNTMNRIFSALIIICGIILTCEAVLTGGSASEINTGLISLILGYLIAYHKD